jgi:hypothetical protein
MDIAIVDNMSDTKKEIMPKNKEIIVEKTTKETAKDSDIVTDKLSAIQTESLVNKSERDA